MFQMLTNLELVVLLRKLDRASLRMKSEQNDMRNEFWEIYKEVLKEGQSR